MDFSKQIRTLALGAALTLAAVGMPAVHAFAAGPQGGAGGQGRPTGVATSAAPSPVVTHTLVGGSSTGLGSASDEECAGAADTINTLLTLAAQAAAANDRSGFLHLMNDAKNLQYVWEDLGCIFTDAPY